MKYMPIQYMNPENITFTVNKEKFAPLFFKVMQDIMFYI